MLDPTIPLQTRVPQVNPGAAMGQGLSALALMEDRQAEIAQRRRALEDDAAVRTALTSTKTPDDAIDLLYKQGRYTAAQNLSKSVQARLAEQKAQSDAMSAELTRQQKQMGFAAQIAQSATDQKSWDGVYAGLTALNLPPSLMSQVPKEYDPAAQKRIVSWGLSAKDHLEQQHNALVDHDRALQLQMEQARDVQNATKNTEQIRQLQTRSAGQLLSTAQDQSQLDRYQALLARQGYSPDLLAQFGNTWSPQFQSRARQIGMTPAEQQTAAQGAERNRIARDRLAFEQAGGPIAARGVSQAQRAAATRWQQDQYGRLEQQLAKARAAIAGDGDVSSVLDPDAAAVLANAGQAKLRIENAYRLQIGLPSLEDSEAYFASVPGHEKDLRIVQNKYKALTGTTAPIETLMTRLRQERDPRKRAAIVRQLQNIGAYAGQGQEDDDDR